MAPKKDSTKDPRNPKVDLNPEDGTKMDSTKGPRNPKVDLNPEDGTKTAAQHRPRARKPCQGWHRNELGTPNRL